MQTNRTFFLLVFLALMAFIAFTATLPIGQSVPPAQSASDSSGGAGAAVSIPTESARRSGGEAPLNGPDGHLPLMIRWSNWQPEFGPALVYARERDLTGMLNMDGPVVKMLMVTSYGEAEQLMKQAQTLHNAGVTIVGLNTENGLTPGNEMQTLQSPDADVNLVARVARLATGQGFTVIWGPIRAMADEIGDDALRTMMESGVRGVALQEQKFIEREPADRREQAVLRSRQRYLGLASELGIDDFAIHVQIMHERCPNLSECVDFVARLEKMPVDSIAIWSNGPIPADFVRAIRRE